MIKSDSTARAAAGSPMVRFPVLKKLHIDSYDLFPGREKSRDGLKASFQPGLTLVLGANGLGKTTLVWVLYRMLSGPYDIPGLDVGGELGGRSLEPRPLRSAQRRMFSKRVADDAENAVARLSFTLGTHSISIVRRLSDLELIEFVVDEKPKSTMECESYQVAIAEMAGVWSFGDWILLLRHLTFYFEDRRELVWDNSAQRQILRFLFLPALTAKEWSEAERRILELDSRVRNLSAALTREERVLLDEVELQGSALAVREELKALTLLQESDEQSRDELDETALALDTARKEARLSLMRAEQERETTFRALERAKLVALEQRFPTASDTARYILAQLLTDAQCLACGNEVPKVARVLESRLTHSQCVVCGTAITHEASREDGSAALSDERVTRTAQSLAEADATVAAYRLQLQRAGQQYEDERRKLQELDTAVAQRHERIDALIRRLPKEEAALHEQREELARLRSRAESLKEDLLAQRKAFADFIAGVCSPLLARAQQIKDAFEGYAREFLFEECSLVWSLRKERIGQSGVAIEFPAFELDLASASFHSPVRRSGPEQVSESQREFIDLAFRMALMAVADEKNGATLVIDAPESSLDSVFARRAAEVLGRFASSKRGNRLIVTSNLTDGELIPRLLTQFDGDSWGHRVVDLFEVAEPTAAVRQLRKEYRAVRRRIFPKMSSADPE